MESYENLLKVEAVEMLTEMFTHRFENDFENLIAEMINFEEKNKTFEIFEPTEGRKPQTQLVIDIFSKTKSNEAINALNPLSKVMGINYVKKAMLAKLAQDMAWCKK